MCLKMQLFYLMRLYKKMIAASFGLQPVAMTTRIAVKINYIDLSMDAELANHLPKHLAYC